MKRIGFPKNPASANRIDSVFLSKTCFRTAFREFASFFVPRNGIPSWFFFPGIVWSRLPRVCFYFCSTVQNSQLFSPQQNDSERNYQSFLFRGTARIPLEQTNCSVYSVFLGIIFCRKLPTLPSEPIVLFCLRQELAPGQTAWHAPGDFLINIVLQNPLKNLYLAILIRMPLMNQCYALGPPEELAPGHPDWNAPGDPMLCSHGHPDWDAPDEPMVCSRTL